MFACWLFVALLFVVVRVIVCSSSLVDVVLFVVGCCLLTVARYCSSVCIVRCWLLFVVCCVVVNSLFVARCVLFVGC